MSAFYDLCIHRGAALSLGWVNGDQLVCAYHGWNYAADGRCTRIPSLPPDREIPAKARAKAFRVQERYGLVWVCLDEPRQDIPEFPPEFDDPSFNWAPYTSEGQWRANAARMIENLADFSHFPWVHAGILGDPNQAESPVITLTETKGGFQYEIDTPVNKFRPNSAAKQLYTVILPFMVTIQRRQPGQRRAPYQYLSLHAGVESRDQILSVRRPQLSRRENRRAAKRAAPADLRTGQKNRRIAAPGGAAARSRRGAAFARPGYSRSGISPAA